MKIARFYIGALIIFSALFGACLDLVQLPLPADTLEQVYIVDGLISQGKGPHRVQVSRVSSLGTRSNTPAQLEQIWVENNHGQREDLAFLGEGLFELQCHTLKGTIGDQYRLHFTTNEGQTYTSEWEPLLPVSKIDSLYFEEVNEDRFANNGYLIGKSFIDIYADLTLSSLPQSPYMRWKTERWWLINEFIRASPPSKACYIKDPLLNSNRLQLFDGRSVNNKQWLRQAVGSAEVDFRFYEKTYINLFQYSLSQGAFSYWQKLSQVVNQEGDIFDAPPAAVPGNIRNDNDPYEMVLGYFGASAVDTFHFPIFRQDLKARVDWICTLPGIRNRYNIHPCVECSILSNSHVERPDFFDK